MGLSIVFYLLVFGKTTALENKPDFKKQTKPKDKKAGNISQKVGGGGTHKEIIEKDKKIRRPI